jgi:hypothetical protein
MKFSKQSIDTAKVIYGQGASSIKKQLQLSDRGMVPTFKGFCKKAKKNHVQSSIKRYLTGLMKEKVIPSPLYESRNLSRLIDGVNQEEGLQEALQVQDS